MNALEALNEYIKETMRTGSPRVEFDRPVCFGSGPNPQERAERECHTCPSVFACLPGATPDPRGGKARSDGSTASYYELPGGATELQHLISHRDMNAQIGEIFRACYRYGLSAHSDQLRDAKKILFYAKAEVERLEKLG